MKFHFVWICNDNLILVTKLDTNDGCTEKSEFDETRLYVQIRDNR